MGVGGQKSPKNAVCERPLIVLFLDQPVTKNKILNNKFLQKFFVLVAFRKDCLFFFQTVTTTKNFGWHLEFSIWFFSHRSNPMKRTYISNSYAMIKRSILKMWSNVRNICFYSREIDYSLSPTQKDLNLISAGSKTKEEEFPVAFHNGLK